MRSIKRRYSNIEKSKPGWSSFICFAKTIQGQEFTQDRIRRSFNELVNKDDYLQEEKMQLLKYLYELTRDNL